MAKIIQHLWLEKDMHAAVRFYTSLIPGSSVAWTTVIPGDTPGGPAGSIQIASFAIGDQRYMAIEAGPLDPFNHSFSIMVECDDQREIDRLWDALKEGGSVEQCGWLRDRWGLSWQITPKRLGELMSDPNPREGPTRHRSHAPDDEVRHRRARGGSKWRSRLNAAKATTFVLSSEWT